MTSNTPPTPPTPPATSAGVNAVKDVEDDAKNLTAAEVKAQQLIKVAEAKAKVSGVEDPKKLQKMIDENDKKESKPGLTDKLLNEKLAGITPVALAKEHANYVTDQERIFNVQGLSAPAVPVVSKDSGK